MQPAAVFHVGQRFPTFKPIDHVGSALRIVQIGKPVLVPRKVYRLVVSINRRKI
ncbi:MAG: hypothetical protein IH991_11495 [Planctomycetes bacterium]|nr:hypothetical protein [Planctomycetota bacterium]